MSLLDLFVDGILVVGMGVIWAVGIAIAGTLLYSAVVYIGCSLPSVPVEHRNMNIYWKGELKHEGTDDELGNNGLTVVGFIVTWLGIIVSVLIFIGYLANQFGVNPA